MNPSSLRIAAVQSSTFRLLLIVPTSASLRPGSLTPVDSPNSPDSLDSDSVDCLDSLNSPDSQDSLDSHGFSIPRSASHSCNLMCQVPNGIPLRLLIAPPCPPCA